MSRKRDPIHLFFLENLAPHLLLLRPIRLLKHKKKFEKLLKNIENGSLTLKLLLNNTIWGFLINFSGKKDCK